MNERFDFRRMLQEIKLDEKVFRAKPVLLKQKDIKEMRDKLLVKAKTEKGPVT